MLAAIAKPSVKRDWFKAIRGLLRYAVPTMLAVDPTEGIASIKLPKSKGHHTWTDDEIERYRAHWPLGTQQRLVMEFALETASRKGEVVRLGPQHARNGRIRTERTHGSEDVDIPIGGRMRNRVWRPRPPPPAPPPPSPVFNPSPSNTTVPQPSCKSISPTTQRRSGI